MTTDLRKAAEEPLILRQWKQEASSGVEDYPGQMHQLAGEEQTQILNYVDSLQADNDSLRQERDRARQTTEEYVKERDKFLELSAENGLRAQKAESELSQLRLQVQELEKARNDHRCLSDSAVDPTRIMG